MVAFGHTAVGVLVGLKTYKHFNKTNTPLALIFAGTLGVISHYIADFIPHGHFGDFSDLSQLLPFILLFDLIIPIALFIGLLFRKLNVKKQFWFVMFAIGGAQLPDAYGTLAFIGVFQIPSFLAWEQHLHYTLAHWHGMYENSRRFAILDLWQVLVLALAFRMVYKK